MNHPISRTTRILNQTMAMLGLAATMTTASALVISEGEIYGKNAQSEQSSTAPTFNLQDNLVMVGDGSGVYLGNGWVLTSTHVGCNDVTFASESRFTADTASWKVLTCASGDKSEVAVFRIADWETSNFLTSLPEVKISLDGPKMGDRVMLAATGYVQSGERKAVQFKGKPVGTLGVYLQQKREFLFGTSTVTQLKDTPVETGGSLKTSAFITRFGRDKGEAQATAGDSGGAVFRFNETSETWEVIGTIFAVSHRARFVPHGAKTFIGSLSSYRTALNELGIPSSQDTLLAEATTLTVGPEA